MSDINKRNFFKGLVALLAMPSNIYAKIFTSKPKAAPYRYFFKMEEGFVVQVDVRSPQDIQEGMLVECGSEIHKVTSKFPDPPVKLTVIRAYNIDDKSQYQLFWFDDPMSPVQLERYKFYVRA